MRCTKCGGEGETQDEWCTACRGGGERLCDACPRGVHRAAEVVDEGGDVLCRPCVERYRDAEGDDMGQEKTWDDVWQRLDEVLRRVPQALDVVSDVSHATATGQDVPGAEAALPVVDTAVGALLQALALVEAALPSRCAQCGTHGGAPVGEHGRCSRCIQRCQGCAVELAAGLAQLCARCEQPRLMEVAS